MEKQLATEVELADLKTRLLGAEGISASHLSRSTRKEKNQNNTWRNRSHSEDTGDLESEQIKARERSRLRRNESADSRRGGRYDSIDGSSRNRNDSIDKSSHSRNPASDRPSRARNDSTEKPVRGSSRSYSRSDPSRTSGLPTGQPSLSRDNSRAKNVSFDENTNTDSNMDVDMEEGAGVEKNLVLAAERAPLMKESG